MDITLNESWINGKYSCGEINTAYETVEVYNEDPDEVFFAQGFEAWEIIIAIHRIWINGELTTEQAFKQWIFSNF